MPSWATHVAAAVLLASTQLIVTVRPGRAVLLSFVEAQVNGVNGVSALSRPAAVAVSPDGQHLYAASNADAAVVVFSRSRTSGRLRFVEADMNGAQGISGLNGAIALALSPDGQHVYAAGNTESAVAVFRRNATSGQLTFVEAQANGTHGVTGMRGPTSLVVSPDGRQVYVSSGTDSAAVVFSRDQASGALSFVEADINGVNGVRGLGNAVGMTLSPDGAHVYVIGRRDNAVAAFLRNAATGRLTFIEALFEGTDVTGLARPAAVVVNADGKFAYVASFDQDITVFSRNATTGKLSFVQAANVLPGGPTAMAISPDGAELYVASFLSGAVSELDVFARAAATGTVMFSENHLNGDGVVGLHGADAVAVSPDSQHVYVSGSADSAIAVFTTGSVATCAGDCDGDGSVTVNELIKGVNIALGTLATDQCPSMDVDGDGNITIDELLKAVNAALVGCPM